MKKVLKIVGGVTLTAAIAGLLYRYYKKEFDKLRVQEENARNEVEQAGMSFDKLQEEVTVDDDAEGNAFIKSIATSLFFNRDVPVDFLNLDDALTGKDDVGGIIHIMEQPFNNRRYLDFLFELPNFVKGPYSGINRPRINEYIKTIKNMSEMVNDEIVKGPTPLCKPELYVGVRYIWRDDQNLEKDAESSYFLIPQQIYAAYADERHDGLNSFYTEVITNDLIDTEEFKANLVKNDVINISPEHFEITDLRVMIKVSFRIATPGPGSGAGITFLQVPQAACRFAEELKVTSAKGNYGKAVHFEHIMVHPRLEDQEEQGELPCTVYENINGTLVKSEYLI